VPVRRSLERGRLPRERRLPQCEDYIRLRDIQERVKAVRKTVKSWQRDAARADAEQMLSLLERVYEDESDVFTKRTFLREMADAPEVGERASSYSRTRNQSGMRSTGAVSGARRRTRPERRLRRGQRPIIPEGPARLGPALGSDPSG
jgi:hypothetical protein